MMAAPDANPMQGQGTSKPIVSQRTVLMAGLACDVYGLEELAAQADSPVSCLWLHHPRTRAKEDMADFARRVVASWSQRRGDSQEAGSHRSLIAVAYDQRNHGGRLVDVRANGSWRSGNKTHAADMFGAIRGMVTDNAGLLDLVEGYVRVEVEGIRGEGAEWHGAVDQHLVMGVSLGGHSAWQSLFSEDRVSAGVVIVGCPDFMGAYSSSPFVPRVPHY